ncbi:MAG: hypothetical protein RSF67_09925, partial [Clostridia bacterium]
LVAEIGQASVLFSLLTSKDRNKVLPWIIMFILTALQVIGNVFSCYSFIEEANSNKFIYFQKSILFFLEESPESMKVIVAWITGSILPVIALSMTSLVENNIQDLYKLDVTNENEKSNLDIIKQKEPIISNEPNAIENKIKDDIDKTEDNIEDIVIGKDLNEDIKPILEKFDKVIEDASSLSNIKDVEVIPLK